jgi:hypothetical protein
MTEKQYQIDQIVSTAYAIGARRHPVTLKELRTARESSYGDIPGGHDATLNFHCINLRSRFPDPNDKQKKEADWLNNPLFKRVGYGRYMLLSPKEIACFFRNVKANNPLIYEDEYDVDDLDC